MSEVPDPIVRPVALRAPTSADVPRMADLFEAEVPNGHFKRIAPMAGATAALMGQTVQKGRVTMRAWENGPVQNVAVWAEVAEREGRVIGFSMTKDWVWPGRVQHAAGRPRDVELWYLAVDPAERRRGVGAALLHSQLESALRVAGTDGLVLARCFRSSTGAKRLLLAAGFAVEVDGGTQEILSYRGNQPR